MSSKRTHTHTHTHTHTQVLTHIHALTSSYEHAVRLRCNKPQFTYTKKSILWHFLRAFRHTVLVQAFHNYSTGLFQINGLEVWQRYL